MARTGRLDWVIGMENKTVWVAFGEGGSIIAIAASDREAARALVETDYFSLNDEEAVSYEVKGYRYLGHTSVREAAEKCKLDVDTFLVKALRGQLPDYWIYDCRIEEYTVSRYPAPLT